MNPSIQILELYEQWKNLTEREGAAILGSDWVEVHRCQQAKQQLQPEIIHASEGIKNSSHGGAAFEDRLRRFIDELIRLESENSATLEERLGSAREEKDSLERTSTRLRQIHRSYVPMQGSVWNHYS